jgi:hypothetical protein
VIQNLLTVIIIGYSLNQNIINYAASQKQAPIPKQIDICLLPITEQELNKSIQESSQDAYRMYKTLFSAHAHKMNLIALTELKQIMHDQPANGIVRAGYCYLLDTADSPPATDLSKNWMALQQDKETSITEAKKLDPQGWLTLLAIARKRGTKSIDALELAQQAAKIEPRNAAVLYELAYNYDYRAINLYYSSSNPNKKDALALWQKSIEAAKMATQIEPNFSAPWLKLVKLYSYYPPIKDLKKAALYCREYLKHVPASYKIDASIKLHLDKVLREELSQ